MSLKIVRDFKIRETPNLRELPINSCFRIPQNIADDLDEIDNCPDNACFLKTMDTDYDWDPELENTKGIPKIMCVCLDTGEVVVLGHNIHVIPLNAELRLA